MGWWIFILNIKVNPPPSGKPVYSPIPGTSYPVQKEKFELIRILKFKINFELQKFPRLFFQGWVSESQILFWNTDINTQTGWFVFKQKLSHIKISPPFL
jgi:hypothetical protein